MPWWSGRSHNQIRTSQTSVSGSCVDVRELLGDIQTKRTLGFIDMMCDWCLCVCMCVCEFVVRVCSVCV